MQQFLVRFSGRYYFQNCVGVEVTGVLTPSLGGAFSYDAAFEIARRLQALGYHDALVATTRGKPALTEDIITDALIAVADEVSKVWDDIVPVKQS
jgi:hypothetical protein